MTDIYSAYRLFCRMAAKDMSLFSSFRSHPVYRQILEHVTPEQGWEYLKKTRWEAADEWRKNDSVGGPIKTDFNTFGETEVYEDEDGKFSPTTLRYAKNVSDLGSLFGDLNGARIVEVGGGYGGLARLVKARWPKCEYVIIDLPEPLMLASTYLRMLQTDVVLVDALQPQRVEADLFVSNYALSELEPVQIKQYVSEVALNCPRGYISVNTAGRLLPELLGPLAPQVYPEEPLTGPNNYMLLWGVARQLGGLVDETEMPPFRSTPFCAYSVPQHLLIKARDNGAEAFVETGFGVGMSAATASQIFTNVISVELSEELWKKGCALFAGLEGTHILRGDSGTLLPDILKGLGDQRAVLWLDAHYSGGTTAKGSVDTPIRAELQALVKAPRRDHFILIDDLLNFTGEDGYPTVEELVALVKEVNPAYKIKIHGGLRRGILEASL